MTIWRRGSDYHLTGPEDWTICWVSIEGQVQYELWDGSPFRGGQCRARCDSEVGAKAVFGELCPDDLELPYDE
jgi:hypothetical protein